MDKTTIIEELGPAIIIAGFFVCLRGLYNSLKEFSVRGSKLEECWMSTIFMLITGIVIIATTMGMIEYQHKSQWDMAVNNNYSFFIDGNVVDPNQINRYDYDAKYDDEALQVILSRKQKSHIFFFFIPR